MPKRELPTTCTRCPRHQQGRCSPVGDGTEVLVVVDMPDRQDIEAGQLLSGRYGVYLGKLLARAGMNRAVVCVTSVLKCSWEEAKPGQVEQCKGWLWKEIQSKRPKVILALGGSVAKLLHKDCPPFGDVVGKITRPDYLLGAELAFWYSAHYVLSQGMALEKKTLEFFKEIARHAGVAKESSWVGGGGPPHPQ